MAKEQKIELDDADLLEIDLIAENSLNKPDEIISINSLKTGRVVNLTRRQVYKYACSMGSNRMIAEIIGIDKATLAKHFERELNMARAFTRYKLLTRFQNLAISGTVPSYTIFALKNWCDMSDNGMMTTDEETEDGVEFKVTRPSAPETPVNEPVSALDEDIQDEND